MTDLTVKGGLLRVYRPWHSVLLEPIWGRGGVGGRATGFTSGPHGLLVHMTRASFMLLRSLGLKQRVRIYSEKNFQHRVRSTGNKTQGSLGFFDKGEKGSQCLSHLPV